MVERRDSRSSAPGPLPGQAARARRRPRAMAPSKRARRSRPVSWIFTWMPACIFSQMRGTPRNTVGAISRRSSWMVRMPSAKLTVMPRWSGR